MGDILHGNLLVFMVFEQGPRICNVSGKDVCMIENDKGVKYMTMLQLAF